MIRPINVLWVIDHVCYDGSLHGGGRLYSDLVPRFDPRRVRVVPCLLRASDEIRRVFDASRVPVRILGKAKFDPTTLWMLLRLIKQERIDVLHLHCYASSTFGRIAGLLAGVPAIIHDYDTEVYFPYPAYLNLADRWLAPATSCAFAASPMVREFLIHRRRITPARIQTMFHAIPPERFVPVTPERVRHWRGVLGAGSHTRIIGTLTKLGPQRGNDILVRAASEVLRRHPDVLVVIAYQPTRFHRLPNRRYVPVLQTDEIRADALQRLADSLGLGDRLRLLESPRPWQELMAACDLIVAPFLSERFSSVQLLEAMAQGKPVIASDLGELREIIRDGVNGYLVPAGDVDALADRTAGLLDNRDALAAFGEAAKAAALQHSTDVYVQRLSTLYAELASNGSWADGHRETL